MYTKIPEIVVMTPPDLIKIRLCKIANLTSEEEKIQKGSKENTIGDCNFH
jgi:hypothetical protein